MAGSAGSIFVDLLLRDAQYVQGLNRARSNTNQFAGQSARDLNKMSSAFEGVLNPVRNLSSAIGSLGAVVASALSVQKVVQYADTFKQLESRLGLVTSDMESLAATQEELLAISERTRQPLEGVYNLYTRLAQAIPEAQRAEYDLLGVTESVNSALAITGEGSAQAASAILQFTQAAASGFKGSGQEINALLDSAPRLAVALQRSFGDGTRSLKELSQSGELSLDIILKALAGTGEEGRKLREELSRLPPTVGQAFTQLDNAFLTYIGNSDAVASGTNTLIIAIQALAKNLDLVAKLGIALALVMTTRVAVAFGQAQLQAFAYQLTLARMAGVSATAATSLVSLSAAARGASAALALIGGPIAAGILAVGAAVFYLTNQTTELEKASENTEEAFAKIQDVYSKLTTASTERAAALRQEAIAIYDVQVAELAATEAKLAAVRANEGLLNNLLGQTGRNRQEDLLTERVKAQADALRDLQDRILAASGNPQGQGAANQNPAYAPVVDKEAKKRVDDLNKSYEKYEALIKGVKQEQIEYQREEAALAELYKANIITLDEYTTALFGLDEKYDDIAKKANDTGVDMEQFAKRAAENIQDAFADFLFDPFDQGLKGMAKGFVDTIRRMIAEAQAAKLAKALFGELAGGEEGSGGLFGGLLESLGGVFSNGGQTDLFNIPIPKFADGGYLGPGQFGIAGEEGAELLYGGKTGVSVFNQDQMGKGGNTYYIDAQGADAGTLRRIEASLMALAGPGVIESRVSNAQTRGAL